MSLGKNIKALRTLYGETREQLGKELSLSANAIWWYEKGERQPDHETLQKIAEHYYQSVDRLLNDDLAYIAFSLTDFDFGIIKNLYFEVAFPSAKSEEAMSNPHFRKGYEIICNLHNITSDDSQLDSNSFVTALDEMLVAADEGEYIEAVANMLCILFMQYQMIPDPREVKRLESLLEKKKFAKALFPEITFTSKMTVSDEAAKRKYTYASRHAEEITDLIHILKASPCYAELGDYYLAMRYLIGLADNSLSTGENQTIGKELFRQLIAMDNHYAEDFIDMIIMTMGEKTLQIVETPDDADVL